MSDVRIGIEVPGPDVLDLAGAHRDWAAQHSPPEDVHAVAPEALTDPSCTVLAARTATGELLGVVALRELQPDHGEVKAMHVRSTARGAGVGRALVGEVVRLAKERGYLRVSLETGTMEAFASARQLYASVGFGPCPPFGAYTSSPNSAFMTLLLPFRR